MGKDLTAHLADIYKNRANYCAMFISVHYISKAWPQLERQQAQSRALVEKREYILPIMLDQSEVPGLSSTVAYFRSRSIQVPRTNYEAMWAALATRLHCSGAASAVFEYPPGTLYP